MGLAWQKLPGRSTGLGTHRTAYDARGGMGGALGVLGVGYAGRSQRRMRRVNRSAARLSRGGIGDLRVECVKEVSGRVSFSIWGAGAPWERPPTDYLKAFAPYSAPHRSRRVLEVGTWMRLPCARRSCVCLEGCGLSFAV